ncbi:carboxypeptidase-like regulatory domain-containing protein [Streptomyces roseicoloratus]|uniref:Carboxypeptidase-like regulatory domain-containing protein n=1 Tax=Streptomyces roseicoloratus TaxID=2508722 RepID=A0ABY9RVN6_9ACTN|nr:carboxypeptidase-like regulatory domain-containing protein [Streptomyces roseicoloratus]WMX45814.1 carboxypeptidase-like regulatory domain-containing protein [Streptomyces roseicoloratus]
MRSDLRRLSAVSLVTALTLGAAVGPAFAEDAPAASPVGIGRALTNDAQRGTFKVTAWTDAPQATVTSVSAKVRQGDTVLAEIPALEENTASRGTFALPEASTLKLTEDGGSIPSLGRYAIDVTATDSLGNTVTRADAGTLDFTLKPRLGNFSIGNPSWSDRNLHPKGSLFGVQPGSGDEVPLPGRTVSYGRYGEDAPLGSAATDETGAFAGEPVPVDRPTAQVEATFSENSAQVHGTTSYGAYTSGQEKRLTVTASADKTRAESGETVTVSGRVTDPTADGAPMADVPLLARLGDGLPKTVHTDAEGRFSVQLVAAPGRTSWGDWSGWSVQSENYTFLSFHASGPLALPADTRTSVLGYKLATDARLSVYGELRSPYQGWTSTSSQQTVVLEQSPDGQTGWKQISSVSFYNHNEGRTPFVAAAWNKGGWFRIRHVANDHLGASVSKPFYVVRTESRVAGLKASPDPVRKGSAITVTGTLQHHTSGAWRGLGSQPVSVWYKKWGTSTWKQVASGKTTSTGAISLKTTASADGWYQIRYYGDGTHFQTFSGQDWVDVR